MVVPASSRSLPMRDAHTVSNFYPMATWGTRVDDTGKEAAYFGRVPVKTKLMLISVPCVRQMMQMIFNVTGTFFTDDYPRVPLSSITIFGALQTFCDIWVDPAIARWTDGIRHGLCGCGPFYGRRLPFYIFGGAAYMLFSILLLSPPMALSQSPEDGAGPGAHAYWRVRTRGPGGGPAPWAFDAADFYTTGYISDDTLACSALMSASTGSCTVERGAVVLNVQSLMPPSGQGADVLLEYSDDGRAWHLAFLKENIRPDPEQQERRVFSVHYTSSAAGLWYGINFIFAASIAVSLFEVPTNAYKQEITSDEVERTLLFSWFGAAESSAFAISIVLGISIQNIFGNTCASSPWDGCNIFFPWSLVTAALFMGAATMLVCNAKERPVQTLPPEEDTSALCETVVTTLINRPWMIMLISELAEAVGKAMRVQSVYWYFCKYVLLDRQIEAQLGIDPLTQAGARELLSNIISVPFYALWAALGKRYGVFRAFMIQNILQGFWLILLVVILAIPCPPVTKFWMHAGWNVVERMIGAGFPLGQVLMNQIIDYDEFLTGQRREAQLTMMKPFFEKFAFLPATALPLLLMQLFSHAQTGEQYDPTRSVQPSGVVWSLVLTRSLFPGVAFLTSAWALRRFPMRHTEQHRALLRGIETHRAGQAAQDPYYEGSLANVVEATSPMEASNTVRYGEHVISVKHKHILAHFFPSELHAVISARDLAVLPRMYWLPMAASTVIGPVGLLMFVLTFGPAQESDASMVSKFLCPLGTILMSAGGAWMWFSFTRYFKAREAVTEGISLEEVAVQMIMLLPFVQGTPVDEGGDQPMASVVTCGVDDSDESDLSEWTEDSGESRVSEGSDS